MQSLIANFESCVSWYGHLLLISVFWFTLLIFLFLIDSFLWFLQPALKSSFYPLRVSLTFHFETPKFDLFVSGSWLTSPWFAASLLIIPELHNNIHNNMELQIAISDWIMLLLFHLKGCLGYSEGRKGWWSDLDLRMLKSGLLFHLCIQLWAVCILRW